MTIKYTGSKGQELISTRSGKYIAPITYQDKGKEPVWFLYPGAYYWLWRQNIGLVRINENGSHSEECLKSQTIAVKHRKYFPNTVQIKHWGKTHEQPRCVEAGVSTHTKSRRKPHTNPGNPRQAQK